VDFGSSRDGSAKRAFAFARPGEAGGSTPSGVARAADVAGRRFGADPVGTGTSSIINILHDTSFLVYYYPQFIDLLSHYIIDLFFIHRE
jgi:hypothetical protein